MADSEMHSILYIFLPCKKVYPIGVTYLADFTHRRKPDVRQHIGMGRYSRVSSHDEIDY